MHTAALGNKEIEHVYKCNKKTYAHLVVKIPISMAVSNAINLQERLSQARPVPSGLCASSYSLRLVPQP